jgi:hypothetical protein
MQSPYSKHLKLIHYHLDKSNELAQLCLQISDQEPKKDYKLDLCMQLSILISETDNGYCTDRAA